MEIFLSLAAECRAIGAKIGGVIRNPKPFLISPNP
jgi:hypothetical protein